MAHDDLKLLPILNTSSSLYDIKTVRYKNKLNNNTKLNSGETLFNNLTFH